MKKILALILCLCMVFALCACGAAPAPEVPAASAAEAVTETVSDTKDISITVYHYMVQASKQAGLEAVEKAFAAEHPELNITWDNVVYNQGTDYFPQLQTALASGDQPEIMMGNPSLYPDLVDQGFVADLTDNEAIKSLNLSSGDLGGVSADGKVYAFPIDFKSYGVFYNVDIFNELGLSVPHTYSELIEVCEKIAADGKYDVWAHAFGDAVFSDIEMRNYVWTYAYNAGDVDVFEKIMSGEAKLADYDYFKEAIDLWGKRLQWMRSDAMTNDQNGCLEVFTSGQAAMTYFGTWCIGDLEAMIEGSDFNYDFFLEPCDDEGTGALLTQVDQSFMVNPQSENYETACEFLEYWVLKGGDSWSAISGMPLLNGVVADSMPPVVKTIAALKGNGKVISYGEFTKTWTSQFTTDWRVYLNAYAESYANGTPITAEQCLADMQAKFDQNIAES